MAFAVTTINPMGRQVTRTRRTHPRVAHEASSESAVGEQKFGPLVPTLPVHREEDRSGSLDYGSAPFIAQLIASRMADRPTRLETRLRTDPSIAAYRMAEALPHELPTGIYLRHSV